MQALGPTVSQLASNRRDRLETTQDSVRLCRCSRRLGITVHVATRDQAVAEGKLNICPDGDACLESENKDGICFEEFKHIPPMSREESGGKVCSAQAAEEM